MNLKQLLGNRIRQLRLANKLTQEELAEKVSIAPKYQSRIETGKTFLSSELIERYAILFNVTPAELLYFPQEISKELMIKRINNNISSMSEINIKIIYELVNMLKMKE